MKIAIFVPTLDGGGAEQQMILLASTFFKRGFEVDFIVCVKRGPFLSQVPDGIRLFVLRYSGLITLILDLARYLRKAQPSAIIAAMPHANGYSIWARFISRRATKVILTEHNPTSDVLELNHSSLWVRRLTKKNIKIQLIRYSYCFADAVIGVSNGVAAQLRNMPGVQQHQVHTIYNGFDISSIAREVAHPVDDPWFDDETVPVILGAGRLEKIKDFSTLIMAFDVVRKMRPARLIILGEGGERPQLENLVMELGLADLVRLPGFTINPYAYMARASVFVLSSRHEGFGNVIVEALACGTPVIATDCPTGPREILDGGRYGRLVPMGDVDALAQAMIETLDIPPPSESLQKRAQRFSIDSTADAYLKLIRQMEKQPDIEDRSN